MLRMAAIECNFKEIDRQLKDQFIHGLNDLEMLAEIIRELTKVMKILIPNEYLCFNLDKKN